MTDIQLSDATVQLLLSHRAMDGVGDVEIIAAAAIAAALRDCAAAHGIRQTEDDAGDGDQLVYWVHADDVRRVTLAKFTEWNRRNALVVLEHLAATGQSKGATRAADTRRLLVYGERGSVSWLRSLAEHARDLLPELEPEHVDHLDAQREARAARTPARVARRLDGRASALEAVAVLLAGMPTGRYAMGDLWDEYAAGTPTVGRTTFYRLLAEEAERAGLAVEHGRARERFLVIPAPAATIEEPAVNPAKNIAERVVERVIDHYAAEVIAEHGDDVRGAIRDLMAAGRPAAALTLQREHLAATGTDGAVIDLAEARARREPR